MITQHRVDTGGVVGVPVSLTPAVPAARHDDGSVTDLKQSTLTGTTQGGVGGLTAARVLADRVTQQVGGIVARPEGRARSREAGDVVAARQQLRAAAMRRPTTASTTVIVVQIGVDAADQRDEVDLTTTVEVASTTASVDCVPTASFYRQQHAVTVSCLHTDSRLQSVGQPLKRHPSPLLSHLCVQYGRSSSQFSRQRRTESTGDCRVSL